MYITYFESILRKYIIKINLKTNRKLNEIKTWWRLKHGFKFVYRLPAETSQSPCPPSLCILSNDDFFPVSNDVPLEHFSGKKTMPLKEI